MDNIGLIFSWVELLGKRKKRLGIVWEEGDIKNISSTGQIVLLQIVIQSSPWCSVCDTKLNRIQQKRNIHNINDILQTFVISTIVH